MINTDVDQLRSNPATRLVLSYENDASTPVLDAARSIAAHWKFVSIVVATFVAIAVAGLIFLSPKFQVQAQYVFAGDASLPGGGVASKLGGLAALAGVSLGAAATTHSEIVAKLRSRKFIEQFIRNNALLPTLYAGRWNSATKSWRDDEPPTIADGFRKWTRSITEISEDKASGLLRIEIEWTDPELAAEWCTRLVAQLNKEMQADAIERSDASLRYLEDALSSTSSLELREGLYSLIESTTRERMMAVVRPDYALRAVDPPVAPEQDEKVWPTALPFLLGGVLLGFILSVAGLTMVQVTRAMFGKRLQH